MKSKRYIEMIKATALSILFGTCLTSAYLLVFLYSLGISNLISLEELFYFFIIPSSIISLAFYVHVLRVQDNKDSTIGLNEEEIKYFRKQKNREEKSKIKALKKELYLDKEAS